MTARHDIEQSEEWPTLLEFWQEQGYTYDAKIGCFLVFDSYKGVTDWMTTEKALARAIEEMGDDDD